MANNYKITKTKEKKYEDLMNYIAREKLDLWDILTYVRGDDGSEILTNNHFKTKKAEQHGKFETELRKHKNRTEFLEYYIPTLLKEVKTKGEKQTDSLSAAVDIALGIYEGHLNKGRNKIHDLRRYAVGDREIVEEDKKDLLFLPENIRWDKIEHKEEFLQKSLKLYHQTLENKLADKKEQEKRFHQTLKYLDDWKVFSDNKKLIRSCFNNDCTIKKNLKLKEINQEKLVDTSYKALLDLCTKQFNWKYDFWKIANGEINKGVEIQQKKLEKIHQNPEEKVQLLDDILTHTFISTRTTSLDSTLLLRHDVLVAADYVLAWQRNSYGATSNAGKAIQTLRKKLLGRKALPKGQGTLESFTKSYMKSYQKLLNKTSLSQIRIAKQNNAILAKLGKWKFAGESKSYFKQFNMDYEGLLKKAGKGLVNGTVAGVKYTASKAKALGKAGLKGVSQVKHIKNIKKIPVKKAGKGLLKAIGWTLKKGAKYVLLPAGIATSGYFVYALANGDAKLIHETHIKDHEAAKVQELNPNDYKHVKVDGNEVRVHSGFKYIKFKVDKGQEPIVAHSITKNREETYQNLKALDKADGKKDFRIRKANGGKK